MGLFGKKKNIEEEVQEKEALFNPETDPEMMAATAMANEMEEKSIAVASSHNFAENSSEINASLENNSEAEDDDIEPIDGRIDILCDEPFYTAAIVLYPPNSKGVKLTAENIVSKLSEAGITYGVDENGINEMVATDLFGERKIIANCTMPVDGIDGVIEYLFEKNNTSKLVEDENGFVDYKELGIVRNVTAGTVIANVIPATEGTAGVGVKNNEIKQVFGIEADIPKGEHIVLNDTKEKLIAEVDGNLVLKNGTFAVDTTFVVSGDVDASVGNIEFLGDILIKGNVMEGFSIISGGSITIYGGIYSARVEAEGKVEIRKGAVGSEITAGEDVKIEFAENTSINCYNTLKANNLLFCDVYCKGNIYVNTGGGVIMGGKIVSTENTYASVIGTKSYIPTQIIIGDNAIMMQEKSQLLERAAECEAENEKCDKIMAFLNDKATADGGLDEAKRQVWIDTQNTLMAKRQEVMQINLRIEAINEYLLNNQNKFIECRKEFYPGTSVTINSLCIVNNTLYQRCIVRMGSEGIEIVNL